MNPEEKLSAANTPSTPVNGQVTDAVTHSNVKVVAETPAIALGNIYQTAAQATGIMFENAVKAQNQQNAMQQSATNPTVRQSGKADTIADLIAISKILKP